MNRKAKLKALIPHGVAVIIFLIISYVYFLPATQGKVLHGTDNVTAKSQQGEIVPYVTLTGDYCAWTNSAFSGMPAYTIWTKSDAPLYFITKVIGLFTGGGPISYLFIAMISFYILLLCYGVNPWLSIVGSLAYAFSTHFIVIIGAGHITKVIGLAYMPGVIAGIYLVYKKKKLLLGALIMAIFLALEMAPGHYQIVYYTIFIAIAIGVHFLIDSIKNKTVPIFAKSTVILIIAALLAGLTNIASIWTTKEYADFSARGQNILTPVENTTKSEQGEGLDFEYATQWSYGIGETFNLLIPNFRGGSSNGELSEKSEVYKLYSQGNRNQARQIIKQMPLYWGPQPFTEGPAYMGALTLFLFVFALFYLKTREKWWIIGISIIAVLLAWGDHFELFNRFVFDYVPLYNKFRAVTTTLFILQLTIPLLGILAVHKLFTGINKSEFLKALKWSFVIVGGFCLMFTFFPSLAGSFTGLADGPYLENKLFMQALMADRQSILRMDALRSLFYIVSGAGVLLLYVYGKLNKFSFILSLAILMILDLVLVDMRIVSHDEFQSVRSTKTTFQPTVADLSIYQMELENPKVKNEVQKFLDKYKTSETIQNHESAELLALNLTTNYRVLNVSSGINFSDAKTSFYHKSLSGYSPAKLRRYQDLIDRRVLELQVRGFANNIQSNEGNAYSLLNMLNTKYIILDNEQSAFTNAYALGNAWFVKGVTWVDKSDDEFSMMTQVNPREEAAINVEFKEHGIDNIGFDPSATIELISYKPHHLTYKSKTSANMLAIFSEIYYPKGWKVYVDGEQVNYFRANYLFRSMIVPTGEHVIEFKFEPKSYLLGNLINSIASYILLLSGILLLAFYIRKSLIKPNTKLQV